MELCYFTAFAFAYKNPAASGGSNRFDHANTQRVKTFRFSRDDLPRLTRECMAAPVAGGHGGGGGGGRGGGTGTPPPAPVLRPAKFTRTDRIKRVQFTIYV